MIAPAVDTRTQIETPENVTLTFDLAGPGTRMGAYLTDFCFRLGIFWLSTWLLGIVGMFGGQGLSMGLTLLILFLIEWGYGAFFEGFWNGRTPGKRIFRIRVIKDAGYPISFHEAVLRNLLRVADILPVFYGVGLICMTCTRRLQRVGDLVAGTMVVREDVHRLNRETSPFEHLQPLTRQECTRRFHVSERTLDVIERLFERREMLSSQRTEEIASVLARPLSAHLGVALPDSAGESPVRGHEPNVEFLRRVLKTFTGVPEYSEEDPRDTPAAAVRHTHESLNRTAP